MAIKATSSIVVVDGQTIGSVFGKRIFLFIAGHAELSRIAKLTAGPISAGIFRPATESEARTTEPNAMPIAGVN